MRCRLRRLRRRLLLMHLLLLWGLRRLRRLRRRLLLMHLLLWRLRRVRRHRLLLLLPLPLQRRALLSGFFLRGLLLGGAFARDLLLLLLQQTLLLCGVVVRWRPALRRRRHCTLRTALFRIDATRSLL